jgi:hypothetical protein
LLSKYDVTEKHYRGQGIDMGIDFKTINDVIRAEVEGGLLPERKRIVALVDMALRELSDAILGGDAPEPVKPPPKEATPATHNFKEDEDADIGDFDLTQVSDEEVEAAGYMMFSVPELRDALKRLNVEAPRMYTKKEVAKLLYIRHEIEKDEEQGRQKAESKGA